MKTIDLMIVEDPKPTDIQPKLNNDNKLQVVHEESTLQPRLSKHKF